MEFESSSWNEVQRAYRKKLITYGVVKVRHVCKGLYGVYVYGLWVGTWSSAQQGHEMMEVVCDTVRAVNMHLEVKYESV